MKKVVILLSTMLFIATGCNQSAKQDGNSKSIQDISVNSPNKAVEAEEAYSADDSAPYYYAPEKYISIGNTIGFITLSNPEDPDTLNRIQILNDDGTLWMDLYGDAYYVEKQANIRKEFSPWAFEPGIGVFAIRCIGQTADGYTVIVNEIADMEKILKKHRNIEFQTIEEHLLNILIDTDWNLNPIREKPEDSAPIVNVKVDELIDVVQVKGEWIQIRDINADKVAGWIRWKKDGRFMIIMYYSV